MREKIQGADFCT